MALAILDFPEMKLSQISSQDYKLLCRENPTQYEKKVIAYAKSNVAEYWIVDIKAEQVEMYLQPDISGYTIKQVYNFIKSIPLFTSSISLQETIS